jgi:muconolactone delta-isomerase
MAVFMVERELPGVSMDQLAAAQKAAIDTGKEFTNEGRNVRYIRTTFVPGDFRCMCLFEAENADDVRAVNEKAQIPFTRITEAMDLTPAA